jgi:hypothetical protein
MARSESFYAVDKFIVVIGGNIRPGFWRYKDWSYLAVERPLLALPEFSVCPDSRPCETCGKLTAFDFGENGFEFSDGAAHIINYGDVCGDCYAKIEFETATIDKNTFPEFWY